MTLEEASSKLQDQFQVVLRTDFRGDVAASPDWNADNDEIGAGDRGGVAFDDLIGKPEFGNAPPRGGRACGRDDLANCPLGTRPAGDRRTDQADTDQGEAIVKWCGIGHGVRPPSPEIL